jgi:hypothetical protein
MGIELISDVVVVESQSVDGNDVYITLLRMASNNVRDDEGKHIYSWVVFDITYGDHNIFMNNVNKLIIKYFNDGMWHFKVNWANRKSMLQHLRHANKRFSNAFSNRYKNSSRKLPCEDRLNTIDVKEVCIELLNHTRTFEPLETLSDIQLKKCLVNNHNATTEALERLMKNDGINLISDKFLDEVSWHMQHDYALTLKETLSIYLDEVDFNDSSRSYDAVSFILELELKKGRSSLFEKICEEIPGFTYSMFINKKDLSKKYDEEMKLDNVDEFLDYLQLKMDMKKTENIDKDSKSMAIANRDIESILSDIKNSAQYKNFSKLETKSYETLKNIKRMFSKYNSVFEMDSFVEDHAKETQLELNIQISRHHKALESEKRRKSMGLKKRIHDP